MSLVGGPSLKPVSMSVRGLDKELLDRLKVRAKSEGVSLNTLVLGILSGREESSRSPVVFDDLDRLVGSWSDEDQERFVRAMAQFSVVSHQGAPLSEGL